MSAPETIFETNLRSVPLKARGKVRDIYDLPDNLMLIVATDRISAFDCILPDPIPGKGCVLTSVSNFWFQKFKDLVATQESGIALKDVIPDPDEAALLEGRAVVVKKLRALPIEAVVRGYLIGSGWKDYKSTGRICGHVLPEGLEQAQKLPKVLFTPSTKAEIGTHDENIDFGRTVELLGESLANMVRETSIRLYSEGADYARSRGLIIADTKFEFGLDDSGKLHLIDEVLTPDSSRFWPLEGYQVGISPQSFDKQFVRDYLEGINWNKKDPAPHLTKEIIEKTSAKYHEAKKIITG